MLAKWVYAKLYLQEDAERIVQNFDNKEKLRRIVESIREKFYPQLYGALMRLLPEEERDKLSAFGDDAKKRLDLSFLWRPQQAIADPEEIEPEDIGFEAEADVIEPLGFSDCVLPEETPRARVDHTEEIGKKLFP